MTVGNLRDKLDAHQLRRNDRIPVVSVLVGPEGASLLASRRWAQERQQQLLVLDAQSPESARDAVVGHILQSPDAPAQAIRVISQATKRSADVLERLLRCGSDPALLEGEIEVHGPAVAEAWSLLRVGPAGWLERWRRDCDRSRATALLDAMAGVRPVVVAPWGRISLAALAELAHLCEDDPGLIVHVILSAADWVALKTELDGTRLLGFLREGFALADRRALARNGATDSVAGRVESLGVADVPIAEASLAVRQLEDGTGDAGTLEKARSAVESFLFEVLEQRPATAGLFELNGSLNFEHGGRPAEVDLLCRTHRIALELDGYFHFTSRDHYRRDRRKDVLLQRNAFLVIRFLAEDVVQELEHIVRTIEDAIAWRRTNGGETP